MSESEPCAREFLGSNPAVILESTDFPELGEKTVGKVRDIYKKDGLATFITTDRYSAFDRNLTEVPYKGEIVNRLTKFWQTHSRLIIEDATVSYPDPNVMVAKEFEVLPIEMVVRGYITGVTNTSLWPQYEAGERDFGTFLLPDGLQKNERLSAPVVTPTTKFEEHDRPLTADEIISTGLADQNTYTYLEDVARALYAVGHVVARRSGLILVDTKYEFGRRPDDKIVSIDEIHTPDSSRYWLAEDYHNKFEQGAEQEYYDKEFLRLWYQEHSDPYNDETMPEPPPDVIEEMSRRYVQVYERLTGKTFRPSRSRSIHDRIRRNLGIK
ncbi:MAG TPA: phosphoribosylaminoimidazolesuccinocarboxamide synthase [Candidatus Saccharimonadales bacterium]|nr:phosphoribosylaminoimidazolesuccinocarboxamide synthase [Candidatus Saccharimonadales bacterium]